MPTMEAASGFATCGLVRQAAFQLGKGQTGPGFTGRDHSPGRMRVIIHMHDLLQLHHMGSIQGRTHSQSHAAVILEPGIDIAAGRKAGKIGMQAQRHVPAAADGRRDETRSGCHVTSGKQPPDARHARSIDGHAATGRQGDVQTGQSRQVSLQATGANDQMGGKCRFCPGSNFRMELAGGIEGK